MKNLATKESIGFIAIILTFIGSEVILDYWLDIQSITTKCWFVFIVIVLYYIIMQQFFTNQKQLKNEN